MRIRIIGSLLLAAGMLFVPTEFFTQVGVSANIAPDEIPVYESPFAPATVISGRPGIGLGMVSITGCRAHG